MLRKDLEFSWFNPPHVFLFVCLSFYSWLVPCSLWWPPMMEKASRCHPNKRKPFNKGTEQTLISSDFSGWTIYGCFLKMMVPPFHTPKWSFLVGKPMNVGETHHFRKHPDCGFHLFFLWRCFKWTFFKRWRKIPVPKSKVSGLFSVHTLVTVYQTVGHDEQTSPLGS